MSDGGTEVRWAVELPAVGGGSLGVIADGLLVAGRNWLGLYSLAGERLWMTEAARDSLDWPTMLDDHSVAQIEQGHVVIRDSRTGMVRERWAAPQSSNLAPTPWGDLLMLQVNDYRSRVVRCMSPDGHPRWAVPLSNDPVDYPPSPFAVGDLVVIEHLGALRAYDRAGVQRWAIGRDGVRAPGVDGERVELRQAVRIDHDRALAQLFWYDGQTLVEIDNRGPSTRLIAEGWPLRPPMAVQPDPSGGYLVAGYRGQKNLGHMNYVYPLRLLRPDGSTVWEHHLPAEFFGLAAAPGGGFVASATPSAKVWREYGQWQDLSDRTFVRLIDAAGAEVWTWYAPGLITQTAIAGPDGTVYVGSEGKLFALAAEESTDVRSSHVGAASPSVPLARTRHEAHLYLDLMPCECGEQRFPRTSAVVELPDGALGSRYTGICPSCGTERTYLFRLPEISQDVSTDDEIVYGLGTQPSELLDPAQWLLVADRYAAAVPAEPERLDGDARRIARGRLMAAVAAIQEAEKFLPDLAERIPASAFRTDLGRQLRAREPGRFDAGRLEARREAYERALRAISPPARPVFDPERARRLAAPGDRSGRDPVTGLYLDSAAGALAAYRQLRDAIRTGAAAEPQERDRALRRVTAVYETWRARHGFDDSVCAEDVWSVSPDALPQAESAWEMVRAARTAAGTIAEDSSGRH